MDVQLLALFPGGPVGCGEAGGDRVASRGVPAWPGVVSSGVGQFALGVLSLWGSHAGLDPGGRGLPGPGDRGESGSG